MIILSVDLGERRVGFAVSDPGECIASPLKHVKVRSLEEAAAAVKGVVQETGAARVVLGHPRNLDGGFGPKAVEAETFAAALKDAGFDVVLWDERLTTAEAERSLKEAKLSRKQRRDLVDAVAAQRILQSYLACQTR